MQARNHFFLTRKWEVDEKELLWKLNYLKANNTGYQILIFPEGTDFNKKSKGRSDNYAETNNLPKYEYVLHPKSTGFVYSLKTLREYKIDAVYDITVGYPDVLAKTEADMFVNRKIPREIHYHVKKFDAATIPEGDEKIEEWLRCRWKEKEQRLKEFYTHREFRNLPSDKDEKLNPGASGLHSNGYTNGHTHYSPAPHVSLRSKEVHSSMNFIRFFLSQLFYTGQGSFFLVLCYLHWTFIVWGILASIWLQYVSMKTEGMDYFIMKAHPDPKFIAQVTNNKITSPK